MRTYILENLFNCHKPNQHIHLKKNGCSFLLWKILLLAVSVLSEWSIENTPVFSGKTSASSKKYILNKIFGMKLVVLYKYTNCTVEKTTSTSTILATYIY